MTFAEKIKTWFNAVFGEDDVENNPTLPYRLPALSDLGKKQKWIPWAVLKPSGKVMATRGKYANLFPMGLVLHFTDGYSQKGKEDALNTIDGGINDGYTYLVLDRNGVLYQAFAIDEWGYHAGVSKYGELINLNNRFLGVECCGMGQVAKRSDGKYGSKEEPAMREYWAESDVRKVISLDNINAGTYLKFTPAQEKTLIELALWLAVNSGLGLKFIDNVVGHDEVAPDRRDDPGGSLSMTTPQFRSKLRELYKNIV